MDIIYFQNINSNIVYLFLFKPFLFFNFIYYFIYLFFILFIFIKNKYVVTYLDSVPITNSVGASASPVCDGDAI